MNKKRNPFIAFFLSLMPPLGQIYNGQLKKGLILYGINSAILVIIQIVNLPHTFNGLIITGVYALVFFLYVVIDAVVTAIKLKEIQLRIYNKWYLYILTAIIIVFALGPAEKYLIFDVIGTTRAFTIPTGSMMPTVLVGDHLMADMSYYKTNRPKRGEIILYRSPLEKDTIYLSRCVAVPGDIVDIKNGSLFLNGNKMSEEYTKGKTSLLGDFFKVPSIIGKVPDNHIIILGDNRENSRDSRFLGYLPYKDIAGKALYIYYSNDKSRLGIKLND